MKVDGLSCFDCALMRASHDVDCIKHTPLQLRGAREMRIREAQRGYAEYLLPWFASGGAIRP